MSSNNIKENLEKAFHWHQKVAESGHAEAMNNLVVCYYNGQKRLEKAFHWCQKSAESGHACAMNNLAIYYHVGMGAEKNLEEAFYWY
ncbi:hypothetical protein RclHR1_03220013 [Rhizophagus clarus]|uniref:Kinase-like domain-containing protein n=1 Tax=Rhizophagus clarus TaxID=94130 RepID=A0A2Z6R8I7_9GLOM|nr:hypothetical protein RclHR1_03220013 [Rhizophagus clarus]GES93992.1 kinase-like domain-containing protein [Rhizophagus clarus]